MPFAAALLLCASCSEYDQQVNYPAPDPQTEIGNIIMIDSNFKYSRDVALNSGGIDLPEVSSHKIGFNSSSIKNTFRFRREGRPVLLVSEKDSKKDLETVAAIRRKTQN